MKIPYIQRLGVAIWAEQGGYIQKLEVSSDKKIIDITCTCVHGTMQLANFPKDWTKRELCKHIKKILRGP